MKFIKDQYLQNSFNIFGIDNSFIKSIKLHIFMFPLLSQDLYYESQIYMIIESES